MFLEIFCEFSDRYGVDIVIVLFLYGYSICFCFFFIYDEYEGYFFYFGVLDFLAYFFIVVIYCVVDVIFCQFLFDFSCVVIEVVVDGQDGVLFWCELQWKFIVGMFNQYIDEVFYRIKRCLVDYYWLVCLIVGVDVFQFKVFGQVVVYLNSIQLLGMFECIFDYEVKFRAIESCFVQFGCGFYICFSSSFNDGLFGIVLVFI